MDAIDIRTATPTDAGAVEGYHNSCFTNTYAAQLLAGEFEAPDREGTRRQLEEWFQPGHEFRTWVAVIDDVPIGHFTVCRHQLIHLFVEPDHQGTGLGGHLLSHGEATMAADGHTGYELHTRVDNLAAIGFYTAHGWTVTDRLIRTVEHGISYDEHVLIKGRPEDSGPMSGSAQISGGASLRVSRRLLQTGAVGPTPCSQTPRQR